MTITEYLEIKPVSQNPCGIASETDWLEFCDLALPSGNLYVMDAGYLPEGQSGCEIKLQPGNYRVSAKLIPYGNDARISRLRIASGGASPRLGEALGQVASDLGLVGVADHATYFRVWEEDQETFQETVGTEIPESGVCKVAKLGAGAGVLVPFVESGFGDGTFPIHALEDGGERVGAEVVFITPDEPRAF